MNKTDLMLARQRQINLRNKLDKAEKIVEELQVRKSKAEAEVITRAILSIQDDNTLMEIHKLIDKYIISSKDRKILGLQNKGDGK